MTPKVPNLIGREAFSYDQEDQAYHYFMNEIGFAGAHRHVRGARISSSKSLAELNGRDNE